MILYLMIAAVTIGLACLVDNRNRPVLAGQFHNQAEFSRRQGINVLGLLAVFTVLFLPAVLRLEVGNDYETYVDTIHEIYVGGYVVTEPLFNAVVKTLCVLSGGENYLLVFGVFAFVTVVIFLKILYQQSDNFPLAFFLFMTLGVYFRTYNTMRYYFVLAITLYSFRHVLKKEYGKFILLIGMAAFFHKSVLIVIPIYLIANMPWKKWMPGLMAAGAAAMAVFQDVIMKLLLELYPSYKDTVFLETEVGLDGNFLSLLRCVAVLILGFVCYKEGIEKDRENRFYFNLNFMAVLLYVSCSFIPLVGRIAYYMMTSHILFIPSILGKIKDVKKRKWLLGLVIVSGIAYFLLFLGSADQAGVRVLPYKSWLFYEKDFLNAETIF